MSKQLALVKLDLPQMRQPQQRSRRVRRAAAKPGGNRDALVYLNPRACRNILPPRASAPPLGARGLLSSVGTRSSSQWISIAPGVAVNFSVSCSDTV